MCLFREIFCETNNECSEGKTLVLRNLPDNGGGVKVSRSPVPISVDWAVVSEYTGGRRKLLCHCLIIFDRPFQRKDRGRDFTGVGP